MITNHFFTEKRIDYIHSHFKPKARDDISMPRHIMILY